MPDADLLRRQEAALRIAREAGDLTLRYYRTTDFAVELKHDATPVTVADRQAELLLRERIAAEFPDDGVLGEEHGELPGSSGFRWILDPIDGTKSFVSGVPLYGALIGIEHGGRSVVGVIHIPALGETAYAATGHGAWYIGPKGDHIRARVSEKRRLGESLFCTSEIKTFDQTGRRAVFDRLQSAAWLTRTWGDCFGYLLVATGRAEVMVDPKMNLWDCAALQPVLEEAGGTFTDWQGRPTIYAPESIATNGHILDEVLAIVAGSR
ncbi:MAG TPA: histidinol-phosphatase [Pirellulales bacterium]|jgi:histidinol phosphatase-like enzyme (inositol monophosphatase family)|nr:histidinol-phosphatase [Pirellulales bacterium]